MPNVARRMPLPDSPEILRVLLDEATRAADFHIRLVVAVERLLETLHDNPQDPRKIERYFLMFCGMLENGAPPMANIQDYVPWPCAEDGVISTDSFGRWVNKILSLPISPERDLVAKAPVLPREMARAFELLRRQIIAKLAGRPEEEAPGMPRACPVALFGEGKPAIILNRQQPILRPAEYPVAQALVEAYPERIGISELRGLIRKNKNSRSAGSPHKRIGDMINTLNSDWRYVILRPGPLNRNGYGLGWPNTPILAVVRP